MTNTTSVKRAALVSRPDDRQWFQVLPGERATIRVNGDDVEGAYAILEGILPPNSGPPLHIHENEDEIFEILEGSLRFICEGEVFDAPTGTGVVIPKGARHTWKNNSDRPARVLVTLNPAGAEAMFLEFGGQSVEQIEKIANRYGCRFVGPPL
jgi:quercetin dioxygenase-like cupin family protein